MTTRELKLSKNLNDLSKRKGIKMSTLASQVNINSSTLHNYFNGVIPRGFTGLKNIADFFEISIDELLFEDIELLATDAKTSKTIEGRYELIIKRLH